MTKLLAPIAILAVAVYAALNIGHSGQSEAAAVIKVPKKPDVVVLIMDEFPVDQMLGPDGRIDAVRYPNFAALAAQGTWFKNASTTYDSTTRAVPEVMDAKLPQKKSVPNYIGHPNSIYTVFGKRGYRIDSSQEATSLCPPRYCKGAGPGRPAILPELQRGRRDRINRWVGSIKKRGATPTLYIKHVLLPHGPYMFLPSGKQTRRSFRDPLPGMLGPVGFGDQLLTDHNQQRLQLQIGFADRVVGNLIAQMKAAGIWDTAAFALTADHGIAASDVGTKDRRMVSKSNIDEIAPVPLFIKAPGQTKGATSLNYARTIDVLPTLADLLKFKLPYRVDGQSAFSRSVRRRKFVRMLTRDLRGTITVSAKSMEARRGALVRRKLAKFGFGDIASLYTGIGPNRQLLGRNPVDFKPSGQGSIRVRIANAADMRSVNPKSELLPTQVAGQISGGAKGARRDLAVAVNGRIQAVSRSFYLKGDNNESFALMVPELSLHAGRNDVALYEVTSRGLRLRLLGRA